MNYKDTSSEYLNAHIDKLISIAKSIELNKITVLTGGNALGKSVIRKILQTALQDKSERGEVIKVASTSMQLRTELRSGWGALACAAHDLPNSSTSECTYRQIEKLFKVEKRYIVIDEVEIGMSKEVQVGICRWINSEMESLMKNNYGILIITHSDTVVKNIYHDKFINIEGMTEEEWLNRDIIPVDPKDLGKWAYELFKAIELRTKK